MSMHHAAAGMPHWQCLAHPRRQHAAQWGTTVQGFLSLACRNDRVITETGYYLARPCAQGERRLVGSMGPGRFFGEMALVQLNAGRAADCVAAQKTRVCSTRSLSQPHVWPHACDVAQGAAQARVGLQC